MLRNFREAREGGDISTERAKKSHTPLCAAPHDAVSSGSHWPFIIFDGQRFKCRLHDLHTEEIVLVKPVPCWPLFDLSLVSHRVLQERIFSLINYSIWDDIFPKDYVV